ncbi:MAG: hypothetical protein BEN18_11260 [Epulopiscium sp. Nuni2H_MBin001]|nr:MAG: hypothetical protein BEN18_11260 [Epulopiscium sp. Nuni2H_MBin001]
MDDSKALNWLLVIFIVLNISLGVGNYQKYITAYRLSDESVEQIIAFLKAGNIEVSDELPREYGAINTINIIPVNITLDLREYLVDSFFGPERLGVTITEILEDTAYDNKLRVYKRNNMSLTFSTYQILFKDESIEINSQVSEREALKYAEAFYKLHGYNKLGKKVKIDYKKESYGASVTYYELYNNLPIFDSYLCMQITQDGVFSSLMQFSEVKEENNNRNEIYAVNQVLFKLHQIIEPTGITTITDIVFGYAREQIGNVFFFKEEAVPTYRITLEGVNTPLYVNAYTNELK